MTPFLVLMYVCGGGIAAAVALTLIRTIGFDFGYSKNNSLRLPVAIFVLSTAVLLIGGFVLYQLHVQTAQRETKRVTADLRDGDKDGIYLHAETFFGRYVRYTAPDEDGWMRSRAVPFDSSEVREGDALTLVTETVTAPAGGLWPWEVGVSTRFIFTVPASAASGLVPTR